MERRDATILVTGGTGHQGGAAARHLLEDGWRVRALVRDPGKPAARALAEAGAELVVGDLMDRESLDRAVAGVHGVYSVQTVSPDEERQARNLAVAARDAGVGHFVQSSVYGAERDAGMPWVVTKNHIERFLATTGLPVTVWRPVTFMENYLRHRDEILAGRLQGPEAADDVKQLIAVDDIGKFIALSFREPEVWVGRATDIAGDRMTADETAGVFTNGLDLPVIYEQAPPRAAAADPRPDEPGAPPLAPVDVASLRRLIPDLNTLEQWVASTGWRAWAHKA